MTSSPLGNSVLSDDDSSRNTGDDKKEALNDSSNLNHDEEPPEDPKDRDKDVVFSERIADQMEQRGWNSDDVRDVVSAGRTVASADKRGPGKTPDGVQRDDSATVFGDQRGYVFVNDRTREVVQVSDRNDKSWATDG